MRLTNIEIKSLFGRYDYNIPLDMPIKIIYGTNGTGKTTILRIVNAILNLPKKDAWEQLKKEIFEFCTLTFDSGETVIVRSNDELPPALNTKEKLTPFFIGTQRLEDWFKFLHNSKLQPRPLVAIKKIQKHFANIIQEKRNAYDEKDKELEREKSRKIAEKEYPDFTEQKIKIINADFQQAFNKLLKVGFFVETDRPFEQIPEALDDFGVKYFSLSVEKQQKLLAFLNEEHFLERISTFFKILNEEKFVHKQLSIELEKLSNGVVRVKNALLVEILDKKNRKKELPLEKLSSGEQQELLLFFLFLFEMPNNSLVLMDEPEISMHIDWQQDFVWDIRKVIALRGAQFLVTTHAPNIIDTHINLTFSLDINAQTR